MNYHRYYPVDVLNGPGTRATLFVSGCEHQCRGCYNQSTWKLDSGHQFDQSLIDQILTDLTDTRIKRRGLSLSGGDPFHPANVPTLIDLVKRVRDAVPNKDIWAWTGYKIEELNGQQLELLELVDVLVDGKYVEELKAPNLAWRGSSNQRLHHLSDSSAELKAS